jgi:hypothetical protein
MDFKERIKTINSTIALKVTLWVGTMWCVYGFIIFAILPLIFPSTNTVIQYISSAFLQLVLLPMIMVGNSIMGEKAEKRAEEDHDMIMSELQEIKEIHEDLKRVLKSIEKKETSIEKKTDELLG